MKIIKNGYNSRSLRKLTVLMFVLSVIFSLCVYLGFFYKDENLFFGTVPSILLSIFMGSIIPSLIYSFLTFEFQEYEVGDRVMIKKNSKIGHISEIVNNDHRIIYLIDGHGYSSYDFSYLN